MTDVPAPVLAVLLARGRARRRWYVPGAVGVLPGHVYQMVAGLALVFGTPPSPPVADLRLAFGPPAAIYHVGAYTVLTWRRENLLTRLDR